MLARSRKREKVFVVLGHSKRAPVPGLENPFPAFGARVYLLVLVVWLRDPAGLARNLPHADASFVWKIIQDLSGRVSAIVVAVGTSAVECSGSVPRRGSILPKNYVFLFVLPRSAPKRTKYTRTVSRRGATSTPRGDRVRSRTKSYSTISRCRRA
ncbi:hypothetical protein C8F04DRAFT_143913 [Mycena alexandri]|uniref:Uncharacterized protein n=1 Tax=Mycena alexandri TaxID=1745969 RepID=A0AAD6T8T8_9AGAR|nr:hypothetical protein C8F04DRAFT_143913 [Mycena alexandri]